MFIINYPHADRTYTWIHRFCPLHSSLLFSSPLGIILFLTAAALPTHTVAYCTRFESWYNSILSHVKIIRAHEYLGRTASTSFTSIFRLRFYCQCLSIPNFNCRVHPQIAVTGYDNDVLRNWEVGTKDSIKMENSLRLGAGMGNNDAFNVGGTIQVRCLMNIAWQFQIRTFLSLSVADNDRQC